MSLASVNINSLFLKLSSLSSSQTKHFLHALPPTYLSLPRVPFSRSVISLARRRSNSGRPTSSKKNKSQSRNREGSSKDDGLDEDAFEALFKQLEEDLKKDGDFVDDGEDGISEEELALLERELEEALAEDEDIAELLKMTADVVSGGREEEEDLEDEEGDDGEDEDADEYDDEEEAEPIKLRGWQLRRLAHALKVGRRKTSIKNLAADLCLDRAVVLELLREPPPDLLMMSAALPDKPEPSITITTPNPEETPSLPSEVIIDSAKPETKPKKDTPVYVLQESWSAQKRLKKAHVDTLERVYRRTKRPTNTMISSIVQVTNLPRKRVVKWFEDKRAADGVPEQRSRYQRSSSGSVFAQ